MDHDTDLIHIGWAATNIQAGEALGCRFGSSMIVRLGDSCPTPLDIAKLRIQELLESGNQHLDAARAARRELAVTRFEADMWRRRAMMLEESLRRLTQ